jgi:hypothetical protein
VVEQLKELLLGPGGAGVGSQVVQNQQGRRAQLFKQFIVGQFALWSKCRAQVVEQIRARS